MTLYITAPLCSCSSFPIFVLCTIVPQYFCNIAIDITRTDSCSFLLYVNCKTWWRCFLIYSTIMIIDKYEVCNNRILTHSMNIECNFCHLFNHIKCIALSTEYIQDILADAQQWLCPLCLAYIFPFNYIEDDHEFIGAIDDLSNKDTLRYISEKMFIPFELNDEDHALNLCDIDHDLNFYNSLNQFTLMVLIISMQLCWNLSYHVLLSRYVTCVIYHWVKGYFLHNLKLLMSYLFTKLMTQWFLTITDRCQYYVLYRRSLKK